MPGIGSTGCYVDEQENEYAAVIIGRTFSVLPVWRDGNGRKIEPPTQGEAPPAGSTYNPEKVENGHFDVELTYRDGTKKVITDVDPGKIFEPAPLDVDPVDDGATE